MGCDDWGSNLRIRGVQALVCKPLLSVGEYTTMGGVTVLQKHRQNSTRRPRETEREKERKWGRERERKREILSSPPSGPTIGALTVSRYGPHPSGPSTLGAPLFRAPPFGHPPLERRPSGPPLLGFGSLRSSFFDHVAHLFFFCAFFEIVSISGHFFFFF